MERYVNGVLQTPVARFLANAPITLNAGTVTSTVTYRIADLRANPDTGNAAAPTCSIGPVTINGTQSGSGRLLVVIRGGNRGTISTGPAQPDQTTNVDPGVVSKQGVTITDLGLRNSTQVTAIVSGSIIPSTERGGAGGVGGKCECGVFLPHFDVFGTEPPPAA